MSAVPVKQFDRIAVLRANALGDFLFSWPALVALREAQPTAEIVLLGTAMHRELLAGRPGPIDRVVVLPPVRGVSAGPDEPTDETATARFVDELRAERFDLALQLHGGGRYSNPFIRRLGARLSAGLRADDAEPLDLNLTYVYYQPEVYRYLEVVSLLGVRSPRTEPRFPVVDDDRSELDRLQLPRSGTIVGVHPGATDPRRRWSPERFAAVAHELTDDGATVVATGTASEAELVDRVARSSARRSVDAGGKLSIGGLAALYERCTIVIANDTGPLHLAGAVGTATVGIFWCGNLINAGPVGRLNHRPQISWTIMCPECGANCTRDLYPTRSGGEPCRHAVSFVDDVSTAEVLAAARELLAEASRADAG